MMIWGRPAVRGRGAMEVRRGQHPSGFGKDPGPLNLKPRSLELGNLGFAKLWQGAGLEGPARRFGVFGVVGL